jgi:hypothetical protein
MTARKKRWITCRNCRRDNQPHHGHGWCQSCSSRWIRAGRPDSGPPEPWSRSLVDEVAVEQAVKGARPSLYPQERRIVIAELRSRGMTGQAIADHVGCARRTVERHIAALKLEARA